MIGILVTIAAGVLTYAFLYACERVGCWLEEHGMNDSVPREAERADKSRAKKTLDLCVVHPRGV